MSAVVSHYLNILDSQRETAFAGLGNLTEWQLWQRPSPEVWSIGEILDHNYLLIASVIPIAKWIWKWMGWYGRLQQNRPYQTEVEDLYRSPRFPHWVGFLWTPRHGARKSVPLKRLKTETRTLHASIRRFYESKNEDVLGNLYLYDPWFGWCNLIVTLRIGIYHDQLHYEDILKQALEFQK